MSSSPLIATVCAYACEGGLDGRHEPATTFAPTIALGHHRAPEAALGLWTDYESLLDAARDLGVRSIRLDVSWARLSPRRGEIDGDALARYGAVVAHARSLGLDVGVGAIDLAWPAWLGLEAWLLPWVQPVALEYARLVRRELAPDFFTPVVDPVAIVNGYLDASAPPWRRGARDDARSVRTNLAALVRALADEEGAPLVDAAPRLVDLGARETRTHHPTHVPLVTGRGPLAQPGGLLERRDGGWSASTEAGRLLA